MLRRERIDDWAAKHVDAERNETKRTKGETSGNQQSRKMLGLRPRPRRLALWRQQAAGARRTKPPCLLASGSALWSFASVAISSVRLDGSVSKVGASSADWVSKLVVDRGSAHIDASAKPEEARALPAWSMHGRAGGPARDHHQ